MFKTWFSIFIASQNNYTFITKNKLQMFCCEYALYRDENLDVWHDARAHM